ncbi:MAG: hypothetical protein AAF903_15915 [Pseudomonadota bacterium]
MAYSVTINLENFDRKIVIGDKGPYIDGTSYFIELPRFDAATPTGAELLEEMCVTLHSLGITLCFELDNEGELATVTLTKSTGIVYEKKCGGQTSGNNHWICETTVPGTPLPVQTKLSFNEMMMTPIADNTALRISHSAGS